MLRRAAPTPPLSRYEDNGTTKTRTAGGIFIKVLRECTTFDADALAACLARISREAKEHKKKAQAIKVQKQLSGGSGSGRSSAQGKGGDVSPAKKVPKSGTPAPIKSAAEVFAGIATPAPVKFVTGEAFAELIPSPLTGKAEARFAGKSYSEAAAAVMYLPPATEA